MIENVKIYSKIAAKSFLSWLAIVVAGSIISLVLFLIVLFQNAEFGEGGNPISFLARLFSQNIAAFLLLAGTPIIVFLYFIIANKYFSETAIYQIWKNKAEAFVGEQIKLLVEKFMDKNKSLTSVSNATILRISLLEENRRRPDASRLKKASVTYIIKKIKLDDIDFTNKDLRLSDIIANKVNSFISGISEPSLSMFWILLSIQIVLFVISQFY